MRYGISFGGRMTGMQMDIDRLLRMGVAKDNDLAKLANFNQSQGARQSANEHLVPEQLFDNPDTDEKEAEGISAVKAIQLAQEQGQKIFTITKDNYNEAISQISLSSGAMSDIKNAINAGKQVTTHQGNISYKGWNGSGYIIIDPTTGTGAYLIDGGANGAIIMMIVATIMIASLIMLFVLAMAMTGGGALLLLWLNAMAPAIIAFLASAIAMISSAMNIFNRDKISCRVYQVSVNVGIGAITMKFNSYLSLFISGLYTSTGWGACHNK